MEGIAKAESILRKCRCVSGQGTQRRAFVVRRSVFVFEYYAPASRVKGCCLGFRVQAGSFSWLTTSLFEDTEVICV